MRDPSEFSSEHLQEKAAFLAGDHPAAQKLRAIPELIFGEEERKRPDRVTALKTLFGKEGMDRFHVDGLVLLRIAASVTRVLKKIGEAGVCPGLYSLGDIYADLGDSACPVCIVHPEKFQLPGFEQDYEWFPEDERAFGEITSFDEEAQRLANVRLIYKILCASPRGNVRIPPRPSVSDYSEMFYKILSDEWKQLFLSGRGVSCDTLLSMLERDIAAEERFARQAKHRLDENARERAEREADAGEEPEENAPKKGCIYTLFVLLRTETENCRSMSRQLYEAQDKLEEEAGRLRMRSRQAFVFGNDAVHVRPFSEYGRGYRCQLEEEIREYSAGEALLIAADWMAELRAGKLEEPAACRIHLLVDGSLKNDRLFRLALGRLAEQRDGGVSIRLSLREEGYCEACQRLKELAT